MSDEESRFFDTNILLYLLSEDRVKADRAEEVLATGGVISVQVLNEFVNVARNRLQMNWDDIRSILTDLRAVLTVVDLTTFIHDSGCQLAKEFKLSVYDAFIVAAAMDAECSVLLSEDMQDGLQIHGSLRIENPFK